MATDDSSSSSGGSNTSSQLLSQERVKLLSSDSSNLSSGLPDWDPSFKCFFVSNLKKKVMAGLCQTAKRMDNGGNCQNGSIPLVFHIGDGHKCTANYCK
ncbi:hypothetical protein D8674_033817 [Pyrus ussuriensis x Pyrus communis]|uniref:Uncharacterized protein n=1 Tax=Pyrus ussuriensis x Pyrus communis TaxID=2448454 RepID=A0A5N5HS84_9ROSA|nr:hypothetical protein D8674_033817 [Pyrus ussuriensis x Pyrus communis]